MAKTKDKLYDTADTMRPYVDRALHDEDLHDNVKEAFNAAREVYAELLGNRNLTGTAMRAATDKDIQENLRKAVEELRGAATDRIQGKADHAHGTPSCSPDRLGILFNPVTGPQTRQFLMDKVKGEDSDDYSYTPRSGPQRTPPARTPTSAQPGRQFLKETQAPSPSADRGGERSSAEPWSRPLAVEMSVEPAGPQPPWERSRGRAPAAPSRGRPRMRCPGAGATR